ncbi:MAG: dipicolinate synthase subunit DpsA [Candidatus Fimivivens sp.]
MKNYLILGGDDRQIHLAEKIKAIGEKTTIYGDGSQDFSLETAIGNADIIICPVPFTKDRKNIFSDRGISNLSISDFLRVIGSKHTVFGGNIPANVKIQLDTKCVKFFDFMEMEEVCIKNAIATAEGAIAEGIRQSDINLHQSKCLVLGYGRCGKMLAQKLKSLDAKVTVGGRDDRKLAYAMAFGLETIQIKALKNFIGAFDFVFNTVPERIVEKDLIDLMKKDVSVLDIASLPGGVDLNYCKDVGIKAGLYLGIPGKYAPKASADILFDAMMQVL